LCCLIGGRRVRRVQPEPVWSRTASELAERDADSVVWRQVGGEFVMSATQVLDERVSGGDGSSRAQSFESSHLDRMLIFGQRQLVHLRTEYPNHYNTHRPHRTLKQLPPIGDLELDRADGHGTVQRTEILGGLINEYRHAARTDASARRADVIEPHRPQVSMVIFDS
jgi:hypothetical protein